MWHDLSLQSLCFCCVCHCCVSVICTVNVIGIDITSLVSWCKKGQMPALLLLPHTRSCDRMTCRGYSFASVSDLQQSFTHLILFFSRNVLKKNKIAVMYSRLFKGGNSYTTLKENMFSLGTDHSMTMFVGKGPKLTLKLYFLTEALFNWLQTSYNCYVHRQ